MQEWLKTQEASSPGGPVAADAPLASDPAASGLFERYEYLRDIGAGGVGSVHCVRDRTLSCPTSKSSWKRCS